MLNANIYSSQLKGLHSRVRGTGFWQPGRCSPSKRLRGRIPKPTLKRRLSDPDTAPGVTRTLHPKPAANGAQFAPLPSPADTSSKKRGRPTKEVLDARRAEAAARGTMYPPLKALQGASLWETTPVPQLSFGTQGSASEPGPKTGVSSDSPSAKKRRGRPPKDAKRTETG